METVSKKNTELVVVQAFDKYNTKRNSTILVEQVLDVLPLIKSKSMIHVEHFYRNGRVKNSEMHHRFKKETRSFTLSRCINQICNVLTELQPGEKLKITFKGVDIKKLFPYAILGL